MRAIIFFAFLSIFVPTSNAFIFQIIDFFERGLVEKAVANCTEMPFPGTLQYNILKYEASSKMGNVILTHYTNNSETKYPILSLLDGIKVSQTYNKTKPLTIVIPGYFGNDWSTAQSFDAIINALKTLNNTNVFGMDYKALMANTYASAVINAQFVGEKLGSILHQIVESFSLDFRTKIHLIGHNLGAHAAGFTGKTYKYSSGKKLYRISGLDPAGPCLFSKPPEKRLTSTDADFVDVIHSDMNTLGINTSIGHVDFYPNGGRNMPGCPSTICNHNMAALYFAESINSNNFFAIKCNDWNAYNNITCDNTDIVKMGYWTPNATRGNYFLRTKLSSKYSLGHDGIYPPSDE